MTLKDIVGYLKSVDGATVSEVAHYCKINSKEAQSALDHLLMLKKIEKQSVNKSSCSGCSCGGSCSSEEQVYTFAGT